MSEAAEAWREAWDRQQQALRQLAAETTETPGASLVQFRPMASGALAVHPRQVKEANERNRRHGIGIQYDPKGRAHITSRRERARLLKVEGMHDNDGGYGD